MLAQGLLRLGEVLEGLLKKLSGPRAAGARIVRMKVGQ